MDPKLNYQEVLTPLTITKPSKSVWKPSLNDRNTFSKSIVSESESTRTDKHGKESFDSYSVKHAHHKLQYTNKKPTLKPPFLINYPGEKAVRKYSNEMEMLKKSKTSYYCSSNNYDESQCNKHYLLHKNWNSHNTSALIKFKQTKRQSAKIERKDQSPSRTLTWKHKDSWTNKSSTSGYGIDIVNDRDVNTPSEKSKRLPLKLMSSVSKNTSPQDKYSLSAYDNLGKNCRDELGYSLVNGGLLDKIKDHICRTNCLTQPILNYNELFSIYVTDLKAIWK